MNGNLNARISREFDGRVVVAGAQEMVDKHAIKSFLAPLTSQRRTDMRRRIVLFQVVNSSLANLRRVYLLLDVLLGLRTTKTRWPKNDRKITEIYQELEQTFGKSFKNPKTLCTSDCRIKLFCHTVTERKASSNPVVNLHTSGSISKAFSFFVIPKVF